MGLLREVLLLPLAPVRGVVWVAEQVRDEAERQWSDPAVIQAELAEIDAMREMGTIDDAEADAREEELVQRLLSASAQQDQSLEVWEEGSDG
ncbi:MAG TPA: c-type cytochrome biogenesis protein CcmI [Propionibacteriaceae bacterium]|nr:c-type cytochrome biogenesis protein CcmI [Propionibacteriaceae bacterium]